MKRYCGRPGQTPSQFRREEGSFLVISTLFLSFVLTLVLSTMSVVRTKVQDVRASRNQVLARHAAESGVQRQISDIKSARDLAALKTVFSGIDAMDPNPSNDIGGYSQTYITEPLTDMSGSLVSEYDVMVDIDTSSSTERVIEITCYAYVPSKADYAAGFTDTARADAHATVTQRIGGSGVFDYSYFINHWGWFYGNSIEANGNVRSNGQFDFGSYGATVNGSPRYLSSDGHLLEGYQDDNEDGVTDGSDGGAYAGLAIVNDTNIQGMGSQSQNKHSFLGGTPMPNLSDMSYYEQKAVNEASTVSIGGETVFTSVLGDDAGEVQNLYLAGTAADPIVINGPLVVRGSVILSGYVTGQGAIYASGNVYVPNDLQYLNGPSTYRPAADDQATVEAWRQAAQSKDALGLFAGEHVVVGKYTGSTWQYYVNNWVNHPLNKSAEDAGEDGIHNTIDGLDGIPGTADDDVLEGDGTWTVSTYTAEDQAAGRVPPGKSVGDVIPGSGEDIDGDGVYDGATQMSEFDIPTPLTAGNWAGNVPSGSPTFGSISTYNIRTIDAALYTNHTLAAVMIPGGSATINMNGSIVSRNESIIYGAQKIAMNHDERLSGDGGEQFGFFSPVDWKPLQVGNWAFDRKVPPSLLSNPASIAAYYAP